jgi:DNA-binding MarR family transcriptional regulator
MPHQKRATSTADTLLHLQEFLPYQLSIASNAVSAVIAKSYEALFGLKIPEWRLIAVIAESKGLTQQDIGKQTRMDKVTVSRAAIALAERGLIARMPNPSDGRSQILTLTSAGRQLYTQVVPKAHAMEANLFATLSPAERDAFTATLGKIMGAAEAMET